jgi:hypothetical protein
VFERVKPLFETMGKNITLVGGNGDGQTCKVANQIIVALTIEAVGEALLFASKAGADPAKVRPIHHRGAYFRVDGPLNVPRPPQGHIEVGGYSPSSSMCRSSLPHRSGPASSSVPTSSSGCSPPARGP